MAIREAMLQEYDREMATTRRLLERVPAEHADWAPHPKSTPLGRLASHLAEIPRWVEPALTRDELDFAAPGSESYRAPPFESVERLLAFFDASVARARAAITSTEDGAFMATWTLRAGERTIFTLPRAAVIRGFILNHSIHHRGQLSVYLRMQNVPLPPVYGPTADEPG
jgi:uncharacterized damage-inducible protein DinB